MNALDPEKKEWSVKILGIWSGTYQTNVTAGIIEETTNTENWLMELYDKNLTTCISTRIIPVSAYPIHEV